MHPSSIYEALAEFVAKTGLRCKEIDDYVAEYRGVWESGREPNVLPYCDLDALFAGDKLGSVGKELLANYGFSNLRFYCRQSDAARPVSKVHRDRQRWDALAKARLATIGAPMTKRGKTGQAFSTVPLDVSKQDLSAWVGYCMAIAELISLTYFHSISSIQRAQNDRDPAVAEILKGYELTCVGDDCTCAYCSRMDGRKFSVKEAPRTPLHIGCRCSLLEILK